MTKAERAFARAVLAHYRRHGRHDLPWRRTRDPYRILVSEVMLQQTQVARVLPKYQAFLREFPTAAALAAAPLGQVLRAWQGLGYNRRAKLLHDAAREVTQHHGGRFPRSLSGLQALPGIGPYTAGAVMAFAYNQPVVMIETNIRTACLYHFFPGKTGVADRELLPRLRRALQGREPRLWYAALMDYGSYLKSAIGNQNRRSRHYAKQAKFAGSDRQIRGAILRELSCGSRTEAKLAAALLPSPSARVERQLAALLQEGLIQKRGRSYRLPA